MAARPTIHKKKARGTLAFFVKCSLNGRFVAVCCACAFVHVVLLLAYAGPYFRLRRASGCVNQASLVVDIGKRRQNHHHDPSLWFDINKETSSHGLWLRNQPHALHGCFTSQGAQRLLPLQRRLDPHPKPDNNTNKARAAMTIITRRQLEACLIGHKSSQNIELFWAMWFTPWASSWGAQQNLFLSSLFIHHPRACLVLLVADDDFSHAAASTLDTFVGIQGMGYCLVIVKLDLDNNDLGQRSGWWRSTVNKQWLEEVSKKTTAGRHGQHHKRKPYPFRVSHITDYLRFYLLHEYGGTYVDTDAIFLQGLPSDLPEFYGLDVSPTDAHPWFLNASSGEYAAPGVMRARPRSVVMRYALEDSFNLKSYDPSCFNCVGPRALSLALKRKRRNQAANRPDNDDDIMLLPPKSLYPLHYDKTFRLFAPRMPMVSLYLQHVQRHAYALHLYGHTSSGMTVAPGSGMAQLMARQALMTAAPEPLSVVSPRLIVVRGGNGAARLAGPNAVYVAAAAAVQQTGSKTHLRGLHSLLKVCATHGRVVHAHGRNHQHQCAVLNATGGVQQLNAFLAECVYQMSENKEHATDTLTIELQSDEATTTTTTTTKSIPVAIFQRLVTVITHTHGRVAKVLQLHESVQQWFPGTQVLASNDDDDDVVDDNQANPPPTQKTLQWTRLPRDSGLSVARNELMRLTRTRFVQLLDDDFVLDATSHLDLLLERLLLCSDDNHHQVAIASPVIPADMAQGWAFQGLMTARKHDGALAMDRGNQGYRDGCARVDYVPNVFMARRQAILENGGWDPALKLGEHEEFFWRLKKWRANEKARRNVEIDILSCQFVTVQHKQFRWWDDRVDDATPKADDDAAAARKTPAVQGTEPAQAGGDAFAAAYIKSRSRIYDLYPIALAKHNFTLLVLDGQIVARI